MNAVSPACCHTLWSARQAGKTGPSSMPTLCPDWVRLWGFLISSFKVDFLNLMLYIKMFRAEIVIWAGFHSHFKVNHVVRAYERCVCLKGPWILICDGKLQEPIRKNCYTTFHREVESAFICTLLSFFFLNWETEAPEKSLRFQINNLKPWITRPRFFSLF